MNNKRIESLSPDFGQLGPSFRRLLGALAVSLAAHLGLLASVPSPVTQRPAPVMIEARLEQAASPPPVALPQPKPRPRPRARQEPPPAPPDVPIGTGQVAEPVLMPEAPQPEAEPAAPEVPPAALPAEPVPEPEPQQVAVPALPERAQLRYVLFKGSDGLNVGNVIQVWQSDGQHYTLTSSAEASGLFTLFMSGKHEQVSRGKIVAGGLQPESYLLQRGSADRRDEARFDWAAQTLHMTSRGQQSTVPLAPGTLDLLSFTWQFAFSLPETGEVPVVLTNGRKLSHYRYTLLAEEVLDTPLGKLKTVHLSKLRQPGEEGTEIWLGMDYHYLPVKIRQIDKKGDTAEQVITEIRYD